MENEFSYVASLIGDPVRSKIMWALLDGRAYTATELSGYTNTSMQNISMHLNKLVTADLLSVKKQGRHRYFSFSRVEISYAIEALANLVKTEDTRKELPSADEPLRYCRSCYDHLAGKIGVLITESLITKKYIIRNGELFAISKKGSRFFYELGIDIDELNQQKRTFAKPCLDWSQRKDHLAGALGASLYKMFLEEDLVRKTKNSRAVVITSKGRKAFLNLFSIDV